MNLTWADAAQPVVAGLSAILGLYVVDDVLRAVRRREQRAGRSSRDRPPPRR